jgi:O-antigen ligase
MTAGAVTTAARIRRLEFPLLCMLLLVLPILEAPKNLALALFVLIRVARAIAERKFGFRSPEPVEWAVLGLILAAAASTFVNWPLVNGDKGLKDVLSYSIVFLIVYRERYTDTQKHLLAVMVAAGVAVGLIWGVVEIMQDKRSFLELHSVGVVTHSSIYVGVVLVMTVGMALFPREDPSADDKVRGIHERRYWWAVAAFLMLGLFSMASRGGILATGIALLLALSLLKRRDLWIAVSLLVVLCVATVSMLPNVFDQGRIVSRVTQLALQRELPESDSVRVSIWRVAIAQVTQGKGNPLLFGVGPRNFSGIESGKLHFDEPLDLPGNKLTHAHNMFLNKLVEEGIFGLIAMLAFFIFPARALFRDWRADRWRNWLWLSGMGALVVPIVSGSFGTPWYNEHALLAMIILALYLSSRNPENIVMPGADNG